MAAYPEMEIGLYRLRADTYTVELRFSRPDDAARPAAVRGQVAFDLAALRSQLHTPERYGEMLAEALFAADTIREAYVAAIAATQAIEQPLRLRLLIDRSASELHDVKWELLRDPQSGEWLATDETILFSRFLSSADWRPVRLRPKGELRALTMVANPTELVDGAFQLRGATLAPIDVDRELDRARQGLGALFSKHIASSADTPGQATIKNLVAALRGGYDILYLVCHGGILLRSDPPGPYLWLEKDDGTADVVSGSALVEHLSDLPPRERPLMVVLASCESAGQNADAGELATLGPLLAEAGIPAVLAMQGQVSMDTVAEFMPVFFEQMREHGQLDQALAAARGTVRTAPDAWMPVLYTRLMGGTIWFESGFAGQQPEFEQWETLLSSIREEKCTPILGPGMIEFMLGSPREIAARWASKAGIPRALVRHDSLAQVAQFLATYQSAHYPHTQLSRHLENEIWQRYENVLPDDLHNAELNELVAAVGAYRRQHDAEDPFALLAGLPIPIYVNANIDNLLFEALGNTPNKAPKEACFVWKDYLRELEHLPRFDPQDRFRPSIECPLVYHMFGHVVEPESVVVSEDDHFDFLMRVEDDAETDIPTFVDRALSENALLFLGFNIDDWAFRVLFRSIMTEERRYRRRYHQSVAVQIDVSEASEQPERARRYLERYFGDRISIYWGSPEDFVRELARRWQENGGGDLL